MDLILPTDENYKWPKIWLVGGSGYGKSTALETLPKERTTIFNVDDKELPFNDRGFEVININTSGKLTEELMKVREDKDTYVIDSFSYYSEYSIEFYQKQKTGYDIYKEYISSILRFCNNIKKLKKNVIITAIDDIVDFNLPNGSSISKRCIWTRGRELRGGKLEPRFTTILWADIIKGKHVFHTKGDGTSTCKAPKGMFTNDTIPNDARLVLDKFHAFYGQKY